jgi:hypothetical protein
MEYAGKKTIAGTEMSAEMERKTASSMHPATIASVIV